jgi:signal transduction histidine kinase
LKETEAARRQLAALSRRLMDVQEAERRHLARELHDEIGQQMTAIRLSLLATQKCTDVVRSRSIDRHRSLDIVDGLIQQVRDLSLDLRPPMLDDYGLAATLQWYCEEQAERAGIPVEADIDSYGPRLPPAIEVACFRIAQEALTNVIRHAKAKRVWVALRRHDGTVTLCIMDDGRGFDVADILGLATAGKSLGILSMKERAQLLGGTLTIDSLPGKGTWIHAVLPSCEPAPAAPVREPSP